MNVIKPGYEILTPIDGAEILKHIERIGRVCYKSEDKITDGSAEKFVAMLIKRGHEAMIEHYSFSVKFIVDRGVSHEIVRHRVASFAQESTRYCNYGNSDNGCTFIQPYFWDPNFAYYTVDHCEGGQFVDECYEHWYTAMHDAEKRYLSLINNGATPQQARSVLPNSLKTEVVMTANLREWRHFLRLRTDRTAHPQMREVTVPLLAELKTLILVIFDDIQSDKEES
ncbi:MAG: FAD-dependent thymidylate synthase [Clostridium sp.]|jgi:thymidylate synthase (FAD)|nr:FAD-dependent thymidylate synthase [Clostridium sp.]